MSEKYRNDLQAILAEVSARAGNKSDFMQGVATKEFPVPDSVKATRKPVNPAFGSITQYSSDDANQIKAEASSIFWKGQHQPATTSICMEKFGINTGVNDGLPVFDKDHPPACMGHELTLIGFRKTEDGKCEVHVRNSWGDHWPDSRKGDGNTWVDANQFFSCIEPARSREPDCFDLDQPSRSGETPIRNQMETPKTILTGQFRHSVQSRKRILYVRLRNPALRQI